MGLANTLWARVTRCAANCSLQSLVASLYDSVLLSYMRLVMHMTNCRLAERGRELASAALAPSASSPRPNIAVPHAAATIRLKFMPIPNCACPAPIQHTIGSMAGGQCRSRHGYLQVLWGYTDRKALRSFTIAPDPLYVVCNKPIFFLQQNLKNQSLITRRLSVL